jgi:ribose 5-phosphate isomerase B
MLIAIGCDEAAITMKENIKEYIIKIGHEVQDFGTHEQVAVLYPDIAIKVAQAVIEKTCERGILFCGTGIGMAITANKVPGIRAAVCHDSYSAERARKSNDAQIMTMGSRVIGLELAKSLLQLWLNSEFQGGGSKKKIDKITEYERLYLKET